MVDATLLFPEIYLSGEDFAGKEVVVTIYRVQAEKLRDSTGAEEPHLLVYFEEARDAAAEREQPNSEKRWVITKPCARILVRMLGKETDGWIGKRVTLYTEFGKWFGVERNAIRVRYAQPPK